MKKKISYIALTAAIAVAAFFVGRNTAPESEISDSINTALDNIQYYEVTDTGLDLYDYSGNLYQW